MAESPGLGSGPVLALLDILCVSLPVVAFLSPITIFGPAFCGRDSSIHDGKEIEMPPLAVTAQMLQCFLFMIYAYDLQMTTLFIPNAIGFILGFTWSTIYPFRMSSDNRLQWQWQYTLAVTCMLLGTVTTYSGNPYISSTIAAFVGVVMCTYPLPVMRKTLQSRNTALLGSVYMNAAMFSCTAAWVMHSSPWVQFDIFVLVSNGAGVLVQGAALILRIYLQRKRSGASVPTQDYEGGQIAMDNTPLL
jgi:Sugar efflux transporter for intercellular exchange